MIEHDVDVIAAPELDITAGEESGPVSFAAVVEVRPEVEVAGYNGLRVEVPWPEASDDEIDEQIDRLRGQYGELTEIDRAAAEQDYVTDRHRGHPGRRARRRASPRTTTSTWSAPA